MAQLIRRSLRLGLDQFCPTQNLVLRSLHLKWHCLQRLRQRARMGRHRFLWHMPIPAHLLDILLSQLAADGLLAIGFTNASPSCGCLRVEIKR